MLIRNFKVILMISKASHNLKIFLNKVGLSSIRALIGNTSFLLLATILVNKITRIEASSSFDLRALSLVLNLFCFNFEYKSLIWVDLPDPTVPMKIIARGCNIA
jgi:hypothetical protein